MRNGLTLKSVFAAAGLLLLGYAVVTSVPDLVRYIKISTM
jgi:hypothetical protein